MKLVFVGASAGNRFMDEVLLAVAHEVGALGVEASFVQDDFEADADAVHVLIPHEFFACVPPERHPSGGAMRRTIAFCVEQPGTPWFELSTLHAGRAGAVVDIQRSGYEELRRRGVRAERFRLGYTEYWDRWGGGHADRPVDVVYLGSANERRARILAGYGRTLWRRRAQLLIPPEAPKREPAPDFLAGEEKWRLLTEAKTLLNVHRQEVPYFEWVRVLEAVANGCVVVSEHSIDVAPLVPGEHFVSGRAESLALLAETLLDDPDRLSALREAAYALIREELPMRPAAERLVAIAQALHARRVGRRAGPRHPAARTGGLARRALGVASSASIGAIRHPTVAWALETQAENHRRLATLSAATKRVVLQQIEIRRTLARLERSLDGGLTEIDELATTPAWASSSPRVTVGIPLYNHAEEVRRALVSVAASRFTDLEVLVVDDASSDGSADVVRAFLDAHPDLPARLLRHGVNRGLGRARNAVFEHGRGELVFALDADNEIYPTAIERLVEALDRDPGATFAYSILEEVTAGVPSGLRSALPWDPKRLAVMNYIDAMSLLRRERILELGGYSEDVRLYGWEDYDLWCRLAEHGGRGVLVPEILCRYHRSPHSMLSVTDIDASELLSLLRERYPSVMGVAAVA